MELIIAACYLYAFLCVLCLALVISYGMVLAWQTIIKRPRRRWP